MRAPGGPSSAFWGKIDVVELTGKLLVALPVLVDPNFDRTVILVLSHSEEGAVGVVLNRPSTTDLVDPLPDWRNVAAEPAVVFVGGPVQPEMAIAVGEDDSGVGTIDLEADPALLTVRRVRIFAGYAGWSPGQLEDELAEGAWTVCDGEPDDAFRRDADDLWYTVLRRQTGPINRLAMLPDDLSVN
jgi:putative transcriptional regulator